MLRAAAIAELGEIDTIYLALTNTDFAAARRRRGHFEPFMRLLDDLGWEPDDDRTSFEITMPEGPPRTARRQVEQGGPRAPRRPRGHAGSPSLRGPLGVWFRSRL
ncbi:hypothetical protein Q5424_17465 [Conexibacter sp. JD483]|uniref:hypothetical protein n=1 Tax=unclassified Conexibacter TaxID=2627773 RepID=UPI002724004A|nr:MULTISPECIES: hypothetical protein [unclassified Conexibacter]MDO8186466.1 hypothetical protein [Conexibacter sp. CPCC 205706]MDO8200035.1 hypothetical protein [Conexibacter sp. CPCC 205762]MDR9370889.1 hypothetical protein [Conexibacter sp. JD483]